MSSNPAYSYSDLYSLVKAIDGHLGRDDEILLKALYGSDGDGLCVAVPSGGGPKLTLSLRQQGLAVRLRARGAVTGEWRIPRPWATSSFQPLIAALGRARFAGTPSIRLENYLAVQVMQRLRTELAAAGWCWTSPERCTEKSPGGYRCDLPVGGLDPLTVIWQGAYSADHEGPILRVKRHALYYRGLHIVELRNGKVPENYLTDFRGGYLIHPLRLAFQADCARRIAVVLDPGVTLSCYLEESFRYTAYQAAIAGCGRHAAPPFELYCSSGRLMRAGHRPGTAVTSPSADSLSPDHRTGVAGSRLRPHL